MRACSAEPCERAAQAGGMCLMHYKRWKRHGDPRVAKTRAEIAIARNLRHGHAARGNKTPEYKVLAGMLNRCYQPTSPVYKYYGGRGIGICARWRDSFAASSRPIRNPRPSRSDANAQT